MEVDINFFCKVYKINFPSLLTKNIPSTSLIIFCVLKNLQIAFIILKYLYFYLNQKLLILYLTQSYFLHQ